MPPGDHAAVERFVRDTLGCGCPDELFRKIDVESGDGLHDGAIHVGGRLLVLLLGDRDAEARLPPLIAAGRLRRDALGYNRVRVVVITDDPDLAARAERLFLAADKDERTHLHVIPPRRCPLSIDAT